MIFPRRRTIDTRSRAHDRARPTDSRADTMGVNDHDTFSGLTPLHEAAANGDLAKVVEIMDDGADVNIRACGEVRARRREVDSRAVTMVSLCLRVRGGDARERRGARERGDGRECVDALGLRRIDRRRATERETDDVGVVNFCAGAEQRW